MTDKQREKARRQIERARRGEGDLTIRTDPRLVRPTKTQEELRVEDRLAARPRFTQDEYDEFLRTKIQPKARRPRPMTVPKNDLRVFGYQM